MKPSQPKPQQPAVEAPAKPRPPAPPSPFAAAFDRAAQQNGFDNWKQLDREQPLPTRVAAPKPEADPDAKPEPPKISGKQLAAAQSAGDVSFSDFMKGTHKMPPKSKK